MCTNHIKVLTFGIQLISEVHWYSKVEIHFGVEAVWRYVLKAGFMIFGRDLVIKIKIQCKGCRYLRRKVIDVGSISKENITIAPESFVT